MADIGKRNLTMMELSSELVEEILSWAPAKSLALMKYTWNVEVFESGRVVESICQCDGLLVWVFRTKLLVLNPLLKRGKFIERMKSAYGCEDEYGLGYVKNPSTSANDYKIVGFSCETIRESKLWMYDFKSDGWNEVVDQHFDGFFGSPISSVCLGGSPYWIGYSKHGDVIYSVQRFNFARECFEPLCLPPTEFEWGASLSLGIFRGDDIFLIDNNQKLVISGRHFETKPVTIYIAGENEAFEKVEYRSGMNSIVGGCSYVPSLVKVPGFSR